MSDIEFSDKYAPLFDLLNAWEERDRLKAIKKPTKEDLKDLAYYEQLSTVDTVMVSGGRDSGKSFGISTFNAVATADYNHRILYTRYTLSSTDDSIEQAQINRIEMLGLDAEFDISAKNFKHKHSQGKIVILGQKTSSGNQTAKLKSLEDFSIFITDEAEELIDIDEWKKIKRSMRASDVQCLSIMVFNPPTKAHIIHKNFYQGVPEGFNGIIGTTLYIHTTYLDNGRENMAEHNWNEYEALRVRYEEYEALTPDEKLVASKELIRDWKEYKYTILGGFKPVAEGVIYDNWRIGEFDSTLEYQIRHPNQAFQFG